MRDVDRRQQVGRRRGGDAVKADARSRPARPGAGKYRNVFTEYNGVKYASKAEAAHAATLDLLVRSGHLRGWTRQVPFYLGCMENRYVVDFLCFAANGLAMAIDVKGFRTATFKKNARLWARYGPCPLQIVKGGKVVETIDPHAEIGGVDARMEGV
jgi:hypothetical protein